MNKLLTIVTLFVLMVVPSITMSQDCTIYYDEGWNMVGLPFIVTYNNYQLLFPDAIVGTLFGYDEVYEEETTIENGLGYWLMFESDGSEVIYENCEIYSDELYYISEINITLNEGWNLISGPSDTVDINNIHDPNDIIVPGTFYGFDDTFYGTSVIEPGRGYWLMANSNGVITLITDEDDEEPFTYIISV